MRTLSPEDFQIFRQLRIRNGCHVEAVRFAALFGKIGKSAVCQIKLPQIGAHAFAVFELHSSLFSHCAALGDVNLGLAPKHFSNADEIRSAYLRAFEFLFNTHQLNGWPIADGFPGDDEEKQVLRAASVLCGAKVQHQVWEFKGGTTRHLALVYAIKGAAVVYNPESGSMICGTVFDSNEARTFAKTHLNLPDCIAGPLLEVPMGTSAAALFR